jgi:tRNA pseudouridine13 synthase
MQAIQRISWYKHEPINFSFKSSKESFIVDEQTDITFSGKGKFLILHVQKENLSTWDLVDLLSEKCSIDKQLIGYAGLKDKYATTTQYISIPFEHKKSLKFINDSRVTILKTYLHDQALKIGSLTGNHFTITLENVDNISAGKLEKIFRKIQKEGIPNYFGYQRFGETLESINEGKEIIEEDKFVADKRLKKFFINAYSSHLFNAWLAKRIKLQQNEKNVHPFKLLAGDVFLEIQNGKTFIPTKLETVTKKMLEKSIVPTGLIPGRNIIRASDKASEIEMPFDEIAFYNQGYRRAAIIFPTHDKFTYDYSNQHLTLEFTLPKSSYATVLLETLAGRNLG